MTFVCLVVVLQVLRNWKEQTTEMKFPKDDVTADYVNTSHVG